MEVRIVAAQIVSEPFSLDERLDLACSAATEIGLLADSLLDQLEREDVDNPSEPMLALVLRRISELACAAMTAGDEVATKRNVTCILDPRHRHVEDGNNG
jgi:hypothetical protein